MYHLVFDAIGTRWQIDIPNKLPDGEFAVLEKLIESRIEQFDKTYSRFRQDSFIRQFYKKKGEYKLPGDAGPLFLLYYELYKLTGGYFTPLIGQLLSDAGYDESYSLKAKELTKPLTWENALKLDISLNPAPLILNVKQLCLLDFGAAGKGYLIDLISGILEKQGISSYCIDAGGDICYRDEKNKVFRVGLENPENLRQVIGVANILNESICGSAGNRRKWGDFHHIIDPFTMVSVQNVMAVWVIADSTILADALSTCLFFTSPDKLLTRYRFEYIILYSDYSFKKSDGFKGELFISKK